MNLTSAQLRAIVYRGTSLALPASAGSGKTATLARRCVSLLADADHPCDPRRILVMTFTRAAAAELKGRISSLMREQATRETNANRRRHIRRQESLLDQAEIGTIDAWCGRIVRENYSAASVDPAFRILASDEHRLLRAAIADEVLEWMYAAPDDAAARARSWALRGRQAGDAAFRHGLIEMDEFRDRLINPDHWLDFTTARLEAISRGEASCEDTLAQELAIEMRMQRSELDEVRASCGDERAATIIGQYADALENWTSQLAGPPGLRPVAMALDEYKFPSLPRGKAALDEYHKLLIARVRDKWMKPRLKQRWRFSVIEPLLADAPRAALLALAILGLSREFTLRMDRARQQGSMMAFGDVQRAALDLLGTPVGLSGRVGTELADRLAARYDHILVDEYQDTSAVQECLIGLVSGSAETSNRFLVGDVKQSIYAFRQADPAIFMGIIARFDRPSPVHDAGERGAVQRLAENFRSHPGVIAGINALFAPLMTPDFGGADYAGADALIAGRADAELTTARMPRVHIERIDVEPEDANREGDDSNEGDAAAATVDETTTDAGSDDALELEIVEREAGVIARRIAQMMAGQIEIPDSHGPPGAQRPPQLADIVVLMRAARNNAPRLAARLRDLGIPAVAAGRESMLDSVEVTDVRCVLALLLNRRNDIALAAYLRGPMVAIPDEDLLALRQSASGPLIEAVMRRANDEAGADRPTVSCVISDASQDLLTFAVRRLDAWTTLARRVDVATLVTQIIQDGGLELHASALRGAEFRVAMLTALRDAAAAFSEGGGTLTEFVQHLDALEAENSSPEIAAALSGQRVRVMTIHASKGLEFPIVFVAGAGRRLKHDASELVNCDPQLGLAISYFDATARRMLVSPETLAARRRADLRMREEELRLLYVAATRAREHLFIVGHAQPPSEAAFGRGPTVPLIDRLTARSTLAWLLAAHVHTRSADVTISTWSQAECAAVGEIALATAAPPSEARTEDAAWTRAAFDLITFRPAIDMSVMPASLSVSGLKRGLPAEGSVAADDLPVAPEPTLVEGLHWRLTEPLLKPGEAPPRDGRPLGTAVHRFMRHADSSRMTDAAEVAREAARLVDAGLLSAEDGGLLPHDDLAWLCAQPVMRAGQSPGVVVRREAPFTYALPIDPPGAHILIRGVIDLLLETPLGLTLVDYKTDRPRSADEWRRRTSAYSLQLQTYTVAAEAAFARPVNSLVLLFLGPRKVIHVSPAPERVWSAVQAIIAPGGASPGADRDHI